MAEEKNGIFITFEGGDGAGKSTQIKKLCQKLEEIGRKVLIIREPGGTKIGEKIREILLDNNNKEMIPQTELLLYEASRAQIVAQKIKPALNAGKVVLADRFFDSSVAYQGYARGLSVNAIQDLNIFATDGLKPDRTIIINTQSVKKTLNVATKQTGADRIEAAGEEFHEKVKDGFLHMAMQDKKRFRVVEQQKNKDATFNLIWNEVKNLI